MGSGGLDSTFPCTLIIYLCALIGLTQVSLSVLHFGIDLNVRLHSENLPSSLTRVVSLICTELSLLCTLLQVEFLKLVEVGDYARALSVARADLGPLAAKFADLLKPLKETLLALARPGGEPALRPTPPSVLAAALQVTDSKIMFDVF